MSSKPTAKREVPQECIEKLRLARPEIAITVERHRDEYFRWDGDGPDPEDEGFSAYDIDVTASRIVNGVLIQATASLIGSYFQDDELIGEIRGYLPQMVEGAVEQLDKAVAEVSSNA